MTDDAPVILPSKYSSFTHLNLNMVIHVTLNGGLFHILFITSPNLISIHLGIKLTLQYNTSGTFQRP